MSAAIVARSSSRRSIRSISERSRSPAMPPASASPFLRHVPTALHGGADHRRMCADARQRPLPPHRPPAPWPMQRAGAGYRILGAVVRVGSSPRARGTVSRFRRRKSHNGLQTRRYQGSRTARRRPQRDEPIEPSGSPPATAIRKRCAVRHSGRDPGARRLRNVPSNPMRRSSARPGWWRHPYRHSAIGSAARTRGR